jgi:long-subunit acyl-CoA synthetase (AMP-forming)
VPEPLLRLEATPSIPVHQAYGMTEPASIITFLHPDRSSDKLGSSGTPPLLAEIKLIDEIGQSVAARWSARVFEVPSNPPRSGRTWLTSYGRTAVA